jgi:hypothetical protein
MGIYMAMAALRVGSMVAYHTGFVSLIFIKQIRQYDIAHFTHFTFLQNATVR